MIELRACRADERAALFELLRAELGPYEQIAITDLGLTWEALEERLRKVGEVRTVVAGSETAGFAWIELVPPTLLVQSLVLVPDLRGRGIGTEVIRQLEAEFGELAETMDIGTLEVNEAGIGFLRRCGFVPAEREAPPGFVNFCKGIGPPAV
jgi:ribosomal protein S18 acetylase RimI-like enzyme